MYQTAAERSVATSCCSRLIFYLYTNFCQQCVLLLSSLLVTTPCSVLQGLESSKSLVKVSFSRINISSFLSGCSNMKQQFCERLEIEFYVYNQHQNASISYRKTHISKRTRFCFTLLLKLSKSQIL